MKNTLIKSAVALAALAAIGGGAGLAALASAQTASTTGTATTQTTRDHRMGPGVMGTVASISGNTITLTGKDNTSYSVDATNAKFLKATQGAAPTTASISDIKVGDTVGVRGTVTGTSVVATDVMDGMMGFGGPMGGRGGMGRGVHGTVTAVSGNTVTITNTDGTSYTVDASSAKISKTVDLNVSDIKVGDTLGIEGKVSGTSVTATHIMDGVPPTPQAPPTTTQ